MLRINEFTCSAGFECLTEDLEEVVGLFNEVIQEPAVQQDKVAFYKAQVCCHLLNCRQRCVPVPMHHTAKTLNFVVQSYSKSHS